MSSEIPRKPLSATLSGSTTDRRRSRLEPPHCPDCRHEDTRVTLRTEYVIYFRCDRCGAVWNVAKPGARAFGT